MEAKELRIGNWVQLSDRVSSPIQLSDFVEEYETGQAFFHCKPIPITAEWLLRFGFVKIVWTAENWYEAEYSIACGTDVYISYAENFSLEIYDFALSNKEYLNNKFFTILPSFNQVKTVHGLQNLYFALTGNELTIKQ